MGGFRGQPIWSGNTSFEHVATGENMKILNTNATATLACTVSALALGFANPAFAQDADQPEEAVQEEEEQVDVTDDGAEEAPAAGNIVVTGSRIRRDTFNRTPDLFPAR